MKTSSISGSPTPAPAPLPALFSPDSTVVHLMDPPTSTLKSLSPSPSGAKSQQVAESSAGEIPTTTEPGFTGNQIRVLVPGQEATPWMILHPALSLVPPTPHTVRCPSHQMGSTR